MRSQGPTSAALGTWVPREVAAVKRLAKFYPGGRRRRGGLDPGLWCVWEELKEARVEKRRGRWPPGTLLFSRAPPSFPHRTKAPRVTLTPRLAERHRPRAGSWVVRGRRMLGSPGAESGRKSLGPGRASRAVSAQAVASRRGPSQGQRAPLPASRPPKTLPRPRVGTRAIVRSPLRCALIQ